MFGKKSTDMTQMTEGASNEMCQELSDEELGQVVGGNHHHHHHHHQKPKKKAHAPANTGLSYHLVETTTTEDIYILYIKHVTTTTKTITIDGRIYSL